MAVSTATGHRGDRDREDERSGGGEHRRSRCSGRDAGAALGPDETHRLLYGHVVDPRDGQDVDEVLLAVMRGPHSYTREDVVEVHCHGGVAAQRAVLRLLVHLGARPAEPGEFTRRAFLNGRIDLAQAESVAAIVAARSSGALRASLRQLEGGLSERLRAVQALPARSAGPDRGDRGLLRRGRGRA